MRLSDFIPARIEAILDEWQAFARQLPPARRMDPRALRDHAGAILLAIAADLARAQSADQQAAKAQGHAPRPLQESAAELHGAARLSEGFSVDHTMSEFRALRASVLRLWSACPGHVAGEGVDDMMRFNEAIDQALGESLARYSANKERQTRLFETLLATSPDLNYIFDRDGLLIYANRALARLYGMSAGQLPGQNMYALCAPFHSDFEQHARHVIAAKATHRGEMQYRLRGGHALAYEYLLVPVLDAQGEVEAVAGTARDITERKANEERIRHSANYDFLTDLPNRSLFGDRLEHEVKHAARTGLPLALLFIDLDDFKAVNDAYGHAAGDELLQRVARRISACVRDTDTVARLGGDEFMVILTDITRPAHIDMLSRELLEELAKPFHLARGEARISASIGITLYPQDAILPDELVTNADAAMYAAKHAGRNRYRFFSAAM
ncbi:MAG TPA: sensor domain-containing diguanylate cyclase, partial [Telluria sp.]|nr:sensor domain-containing diguanylate cyclase [Telluria sp.]